MNLQTLMEQQKALREQVNLSGKAALAEAFKQFFETNPTVVAVKWTQYTPHFNDGDPCVFRLGDFEFALRAGETYLNWQGKPVVCTDDLSDDDNYQYMNRLTDEQRGSLKNIDEDVEQIFEEAFGDGYKIIATRDGFDVQEYDHD